MPKTKSLIGTLIFSSGKSDKLTGANLNKAQEDIKRISKRYFAPYNISIESSTGNLMGTVSLVLKASYPNNTDPAKTILPATASFLKDIQESGYFVHGTIEIWNTPTKSQLITIEGASCTLES